MTHRLSLLAAAALAGGLTVVPAPAQAAGLRYASPTGTDGASCLTPATACSLTKAVNSAVAGDEVVVASGSYTVSVGLDKNGVYVHGVAGQPRPVISTSASNGLRLQGDGSRATDLTIVHTGTGTALDVFSGTWVERVEVRTTGPSACHLGLNNQMRDSLCASSGAGGSAIATGGNSLGTHTVRLRNVTAVASGTNSVGIDAGVGQDGDLTVDLRNVVASGTTDLKRSPGGTSSATFVAATSNYDTTGGSGPGTATTPGSATNQTAPPVFAETTTYHQAASSPTVNAGSADAYTGTVDLDGDPRPTGPALDIGVDEYVAPPVQPDTTAPDTTFTKTTKKRTFSHRAKFLFGATEAGVTYTCRLDAKPAAPCTSPWKKRVRKPGSHTFAVWARDAAGNTDATPATWTWKIKQRR